MFAEGGLFVHLSHMTNSSLLIGSTINYEFDVDYAHSKKNINS